MNKETTKAKEFLESQLKLNRVNKEHVISVTEIIDALEDGYIRVSYTDAINARRRDFKVSDSASTGSDITGYYDKLTELKAEFWGGKEWYTSNTLALDGPYGYTYQMLVATLSQALVSYVDLRASVLSGGE